MWLTCPITLELKFYCMHPIQFLNILFCSNNHVMPYYSADTPVPLRINMVGSSTTAASVQTSFHHIYDITLFAPLGERDDNFFAVSIFNDIWIW